VTYASPAAMCIRCEHGQKSRSIARPHPLVERLDHPHQAGSAPVADPLPVHLGVALDAARRLLRYVEGRSCSVEVLSQSFAKDGEGSALPEIPIGESALRMRVDLIEEWLQPLGHFVRKLHRLAELAGR